MYSYRQNVQYSTIQCEYQYVQYDADVLCSKQNKGVFVAFSKAIMVY